MKKSILYLFLCITLLAGCATQLPETVPGHSDDFSYRFTDDTGREILLTSRPKKVAVLLSSLADLWVTAGGTVDITVGESVERGFAQEDVLLVDSGAGKTINTEALIGAKPDFVLYSSDLAGQLECAGLLTDAGIPAAGFAVETFDDYLKILKIATDLLDTPQNYETHGLQVQAEIQRLLSLAQAQPVQPAILFVRAGSSAKYTKAKTAANHFVCAMLDELGSTNIADKAPILLDGLSTEEILLSDPDFIFFTTMGSEDAANAYIDSLLADPVWKSMSAVKNGKVCYLPKDLFQFKPNARWAEAYEYLISLLYGDIL